MRTTETVPLFISESVSGEFIIPVPQISRDVSCRNRQRSGEGFQPSLLHSLVASPGGKMTRAERRYLDPTRPKVEQKHWKT